MIQLKLISLEQKFIQLKEALKVIFCYYLNKNLQNLNLKKCVKLQAYVDDTVILSNDIKDLYDSYITLKKSLQNYDLIINPEKCKLLSDNIEDKISDEDEGIDILARKEVTYLGQKINNDGEACQIIDEKLFGKIKNKLQKVKD